ncbi:MAG: hypothetical protein Fur0016_07170 [Anaerolineales bacterium]
MPASFLWVIVVLLIFTSVGLLVSREWRWSIALLAGQYFAAFWLVSLHWPLAMAAAKLVTGWMAAAALGMTQVNLKQYQSRETSWPQGRAFRLFSAGLVLLAVFAVSRPVTAWLPGANLLVVSGSLILISLGLLNLGMTANPLRVTFGLLTVLLGFETLYVAVENSILVAGMLSAITLGLALAGSYLVALTSAEDSP